MGGRDYNFQIVFRGKSLPYFRSGGVVIFQLSNKTGNGFWLGRTFSHFFEFERLAPLSYRDAFCLAKALTEPESNVQAPEPDDQLNLF